MIWLKANEHYIESKDGRFTVTRCNDPVNPGRVIYGAWIRCKRDTSGKLKEPAVDLGQRFATVQEAQRACYDAC